jgi:4-amino-4-deoxy-L-arabinose transferase-like glycosyltransferase
MRSGTNKKFPDGVIAGLIALVVIMALLLTTQDIGLTWDEPAYIAASESYAEWFRLLFTRPGHALSGEKIDQFWAINHEHPPVDKIGSGIVWSLARFVFDDLVAHRLGNMLLVAALVALYKMVAGTYGRRAGLLAAGLLMTLPRFFFHAHLSSLDVPAAVTTFFVVTLSGKPKTVMGGSPP